MEKYTFWSDYSFDNYKWFIVEYVCREAVEVYASCCSKAIESANAITGLCTKDIKAVKDVI